MAHPNTTPYSGFICLICGDRFAKRTSLDKHWDTYNHHPASVQDYALRRSRAVLTGERISMSDVPVGLAEPVE